MKKKLSLKKKTISLIDSTTAEKIKGATGPLLCGVPTSDLCPTAPGPSSGCLTVQCTGRCGGNDTVA